MATATAEAPTAAAPQQPAVRLVLDCSADLGESPTWDARNGRLYFVSTHYTHYTLYIDCVWLHGALAPCEAELMQLPAPRPATVLPALQLSGVGRVVLAAVAERLLCGDRWTSTAARSMCWATRARARARRAATRPSSWTSPLAP